MHFFFRARICKHLRSPGIDSKESIPPVNVAWRAGTSNRVVVPACQAGNQFLGSLKCLQIRARFLCGGAQPTSKNKNSQALYSDQLEDRVRIPFRNMRKETWDPRMIILHLCGSRSWEYGKGLGIGRKGVLGGWLGKGMGCDGVCGLRMGRGGGRGLTGGGGRVWDELHGERRYVRYVCG